jgi:hypothetical protein
MRLSAASPFVAHQIAPEDSVKAGNQFFDETVPKLVLLRKRWDNETGLDNHFPLEIKLTAKLRNFPEEPLPPNKSMQRPQHPPTFFSTEYSSQVTALSTSFFIPATAGLATRRCCEAGLTLLSFHGGGLVYIYETLGN